MRGLGSIFFVSLFTIILAKATFCIGQSDILFNRITTDDGLSTNNVRAFVQDYQGFMWIGTEDGLQRYDGYEFKNYRKKSDDSTSLSGNFIMSLFEDSYRRLWVGTLDQGLSLYDRNKDCFYTYYNKPDENNSIYGNTISSFCETDDKLWITTEQGGFSYIDIKSFNPENPVFNNFSLPPSMIASGAIWVRNIIPGGDNLFWLGINGAGLALFDVSTGMFQDVIDVGKFNEITFDKRLTSIYKDSKGRIWMGSWRGGLYLYNPQTEMLINYKMTSSPFSLPNNQIDEMLEDETGNFWIASDDGLCRMTDFHDDLPEGRFEVYKNDVFIDQTLSTNAIKTLYEDREGRLWIGSYFGGISVYDPDYLRFQTIRHHPLIPNSLPGNNVTAIKSDNDGNLLVGLDNDGLCLLPGGSANIGENLYEIIELKNSRTGELEKKIKSIEVDRHGCVWVGTWGGGLFRYNLKTKKYRHFLYGQHQELPSESVISLAADGDFMWIGTFNDGLIRYDVNQNTYRYYKYTQGDTTTLGSNKIFALLNDDEGNLWIGTESGGLNVLDKNRDMLRRIKMKGLTSQSTIICIYQCHDGYIWVGTHSEGLIRLDPHTFETWQYDTQFGLPGDMVQSIAVDHDQYLWISTNSGISKFVFSQNSVTNYSKEEGLQSRQFNPNSVFVCDDGMMLFGGINGLNAFYPNNIHKSESAPELVFTGFSLNNQPAEVGTGEYPLSENIIIARDVNLKSGQNSFSVEYAALEYDFSRRTQYMTYLEGFDTDWQNRRTERKVTYTNLNPGTYQLHVKAINKDGFVSDKVSTLVIKVLPAWYQTKTFLVLMIVFIFGGAYTLVQLRINFFKRQSRKLEEKVKKRTKEINLQSNEILAQNEELQAQNDQILKQREELEAARDQLEQMNTHLEELVKNRTKKLEKTINELDRFVYSASHDLSAPLKSVLGLLNIAKIDQDKTQLKEYLRYIEDSILKLEEVIKSLIAYSRNTRLEVQMQRFNLYDLVDEVIAELAFLPDTKNIKFLKHIEKDCIISSDRQRLKIVLHNLINNSIKYADTEKPESFVKIGCHHNDKKHVIRIEDNGIGIDEALQPKIFTMFFRATEKSDGSGLGLFIVKETLSALKGKIKVFSVPGEETAFQISLPLL